MKRQTVQHEHIVLSDNLVASLRGKILPECYRAEVTRKPADKYSPNGNGDVIAVYQPIDGEWHFTGGYWYAETLLGRDGDYRGIDDSIYIDWGARWSIVQGMREALARYVELTEGGEQ